MAGLIDDPNDENAVLVDHEMRLRRMERSPQIGFTSIDEGSLRVASEEGLLVEGSQKITGTLFGDGVIDWTGTAKFRNPGTLEAGDSTFQDVKITETLDVTAESTLRSLVTLLSNLLVQGGGKITVEGGITLVIENGILTFANGAQVRGSSGGVTVDGGGGAQMQISLGNAALQSGGNSVSVDGVRTTVDGPSLFNGDAVLSDDLYAGGLPVAPLVGVPSGALVREPGTGRIYVAL